MTAKWNMEARVFTTTPGHVLCIGSHGFATNDVGVLVPDDVADQLEREIAGRVTDAERAAGITPRPKRTDIRVERLAPPPAPVPKQPMKPAGAGKPAASLKDAGEKEE